MSKPRQRPAHGAPSDEDEAREAAAAARFAAELEAFEQGRPPARSGAAGGGPAVGARVRGRVVSIDGDAMLVDVGGRSEAVADAREFRDDQGGLTVAPGDVVELNVVEAGDSLVLARTARRQGKPSFAALRQAREADLPVRGRVTAVNKGGLAVDVDGVRAFCPLSQVDEHFVEDAGPYVGRVLEFLVTEVDESRGRAVVSRRRWLARRREQEARERLASLRPGLEVEGVVSRLETFGAFVDLGGLEGLVHVSELAHDRVGHPREVVSVGERLRLKVLSVQEGERGRPRVALSRRALAPDPWSTLAQRFAPGARVSGVVVRLADFGAFVNVAPGVDGLVHVSQVSDRRISHVRDVLSPGQAVEVVVLAVEPERRRLSLSIREALEHPVEPSRMTGAEPEPGPVESGPRPPTESGPEPLTPMQLAFRRARERARESGRKE